MTEPEEPPPLGDEIQRPKLSVDIGRLIVSCLVTLAAVPMLMIATCIPMIPGMSEREDINTWLTTAGFKWLIIVGVLFVVSVIIVVIRVKDSSVRIGIATAVATILAVICQFLF